MLLMGDELRRTQRGNNNAYCHDSEVSWFDWHLLERHAGLHRFVTMLIQHRLRRHVAGAGETLTLNELLERTQLEWHGVVLNQPDWGEHSHSLALTVRMPNGQFVRHVMLNAYWEPLTFALPPAGDGREPWRRCIDTALEAPDDIHPWEDAPFVSDATYAVQPRSVVLLMTRQ
jgi:isoamylase